MCTTFLASPYSLSWQSHRSYSPARSGRTAAGPASTLLALEWGADGRSAGRFGAELFAGWNGLVQRVLILVPLVWIAVIGARLVEIAGAGRLFTPEESGRTG